MSSTNLSNPPNLPEDMHFDGTNYITFKNQVLIAARAWGACRYLDGTIKKLEETQDIKQSIRKSTEWSLRYLSLEEWEERDTWTLGLIIYNTRNPVSLGIKMDDTTVAVWKTLTKNYRVFSEIAAMNVERWLCNTEFMDRIDFLKHAKDLREK